MKKIYNEIALLGKKFGASEIKLFGSRERSDNRERPSARRRASQVSPLGPHKKS